MEKLIAVRLEEEHIQKLSQLVEMTGWNQSDILRKLIENAWVTPPAIGSSVAPKGMALAVNSL